MFSKAAQEFNLIYDANGNLISGDGFLREYNSLNQLVRIKNDSGNVLEEFVWHPIEEKILIKKIYNSSNEVAQRIVYINQNTVKIKNSSGTFYEHYIYQDNVLVAQLNTDGQKQFIHSDHEGSNTLITDINGNVVENSFYSPFGEIIEGGKVSRFDYEAKEYDSSVDDVDFHFRKYKPQWGKFTQPDTLIQNVYDPQSLNRYAFERNNPYKYTDPDGHIALATVFIRFIIGLVISEVVSVTTESQYQEYLQWVPEEEQNQFLKNLYEFTNPTDYVVTGGQFGVIASKQTRHAYRTTTYKMLSKIGNFLTGADVAFYLYFKDRTNYYKAIYHQELERSLQSNYATILEVLSDPKNYNRRERRYDLFGIDLLVQRWALQNPDKTDALKEEVKKSKGSSGTLLKEHCFVNQDPNGCKYG